MFHSQQWGSYVGICLQFVSSEQQSSAPSISHLFSVTISQQCIMAWCGLLQSNVYFSMTTMQNTDLLKVSAKIFDERVPSRQTIHNLLNKIRSTGLLIDKKVYG
jgi:hypothetical protein